MYKYRHDVTHRCKLLVICQIYKEEANLLFRLLMGVEYACLLYTIIVFYCTVSITSCKAHLQKESQACTHYTVHQACAYHCLNSTGKINCTPSIFSVMRPPLCLAANERKVYD